jgi:DNA-binding MarR family transcriptional regulator
VPISKVALVEDVIVTKRAGQTNTAGAVERVNPPPFDEGSAQLEFGDLANDIGFLVRRAQVWIFQDFIKTLSSCNIRPAQYSVLTMIAENPGLSQMALSKALNIERAQLMHMLDALETRGLLKRELSSRDRRSHALHLTTTGLNSLKNIKQLVAKHRKQVAEKLGRDSAAQLVNALSIFR